MPIERHVNGGVITSKGIVDAQATQRTLIQHVTLSVPIDMAQWFGVPSANLPAVFPNIANFATANLGFLG